MKVTEYYKTYDFSSTKCFIITFQAESAVTKIDETIPPIAKKLKGIFISARCNTEAKLIGVINLNFNDGALKPCNLPVINSTGDLINTSPVRFDEIIKPHSNVTGYYRDFGNGAIRPLVSQLFISIYIHYTT